MTSIRRNQPFCRDIFRVLVLTMFLGWGSSGLSDAASVVRQNLADLVLQSDLILLGTVTGLSEGFTVQGIPYSEITLDVTESLRGYTGPMYRFRQFGLLETRRVGGGLDYLGITPQGVPRWSVGETVLVFLHQPARHTGLQSTVGMEQGKLREVEGRFERASGIQTLFENLVVEAGDLTSDQIDMLRGDTRVVNASSLLALLRRVVDENWVESGVMRHAE